MPKKWFYGRSGSDGEPDYTGPARLKSRREAEKRWGANYETAGPFDTSREALEHLDAWISSGEDA